MIKLLLILAIFLQNGLVSAQVNYLDTTLLINKQIYSLEFDSISPDDLTLTIRRNTLIVQTDTLASAGLWNSEYFDFNQDGNTDIMLTYTGNNDWYYLYLFDPIEQGFNFVEGFDQFPLARPLDKNPGYYYSYYGAGCADLEWVSDLFYIEDFKTIYLGSIYGHGCEFENEEKTGFIEIFQVVN